MLNPMKKDYFVVCAKKTL